MTRKLQTNILCAFCACYIPQLCPTRCDPIGHSPWGSSAHGDFPGKNTRVSCHALIQGVFPTQWLNPRLLSLLLGRQVLYPQAPPQFSSVQSLSKSESWWPHGLEQTRLPCPSPAPRVCSNLCPLSWWCHPSISSSVVPFSSGLQYFPASRSFPRDY